MLTQYGHGEIKWGEQVYKLTPSFINIAKLGTPKEIIETFKHFIVERNIVHKFNCALSIVRACCDRELPTSLTGDVKYSERQQRFLIVYPAHGYDMVNDIIVLAEHCLLHGVTGKVPQDDIDEDAKPMEEFDAYKYMELARIHLNMSVEESGNMTMTEWLRMMSAKFPEQQKDDKPTKKQEKEMLDWYFKKNDKVAH